MPSYFERFPKINYKFRYTDNNGKKINLTKNMTNITVRFVLSQEVIDLSSAFYPFQWPDTERPDSFAHKYYGNDDLYWLVMYSGEKFDVHNEFPKDDKQFYNYLYRKYREEAIANSYADTVDGVVGYTKQAIHSYRDSDGDTIDFDTYAANASGNSIIRIFDKEEEDNLLLRSMNIVDDRFSSRIRKEFENKLNALRKELSD